MIPTALSLEAVRTRLAEIVGAPNVVAAEALAAYSAQGESPVAAVLPAGDQEMAEVARLAGQERIPVIPWGAGTKQDVEPVQPREGIVLVTTRLSSTVELDAANLTVTAGAGKVLEELQRELAGVRLFLPLDPPDSARSTLGGTLATNSSGPNRLLYRTARDWVLGLREVTPLGSTTRTGGKTVKDVAGYDLKKLYLGSWGTLGAITEATFRLLPLPEASATVAMAFPLLSNACGAVSGLLASFLRPSTAELLSHDALPATQAASDQPGALTPVASGLVPDARTSPTGPEAAPPLPFDLPPGEYLLLVQVEGAREAVDRQARDLLALAARNGARETAMLEGAEEQRLWRLRKGALAQRPPRTEAMLVKGSVLLKRLFDFVAGLVSLRDQGLRVSLASHAGNGIVHALVAAEAGRADRLVTAAAQLQRLAADCGGFALVQRAPREVAERVSPWPPRSDYGMMRGIKAHLDPNGLWNPARIPGGRA